MSIEPREQADSLPVGLSVLRHLPIPRKLGMLERIYGEKLACRGKSTLILSNGHVWTLDLADVTHRWLVYGDYEGFRQMTWLKRWLSCGGVFIDSGANIGQMVVSLSYLEGVQTFAFEPVSTEREWLESCLERYPDWAVSVLPYGLSDRRQQLSIRLAGGRSTLRTDWYRSQQLAEEKIDLLTLDEFSQTHGINRIRLWKLDMEGHEVQALAGAQKLLAARRIDALLIEAQTNTIPLISTILAPAHYSLYTIITPARLARVTDTDQPQSFSGNLLALPD